MLSFLLYVEERLAIVLLDLLDLLADLLQISSATFLSNIIQIGFHFTLLS